MKSIRAFAFLSLAFSCASAAYADSFGSGLDLFDIKFVTIGNPGNVADTTGSPIPPYPTGSVTYAYNIGKFEVSCDMVTKANSAGGLGITLAGMTPYGGNGANRPATGVSWNEAARFVNWLNTSKGFAPAYKFTTQPGDGGYGANQNIALWVSGDAGFNAANPFRNSRAHYFLPSVDEWYKAAYYDPTNSVYYDYPTGSNIAPTAVASGTAAGTAVYLQAVATGPADITLAGVLGPYGTMGQGGNVFEWVETEFDLANNSSSSLRVRFFAGFAAAAGSASPTSPATCSRRTGTSTSSRRTRTSILVSASQVSPSLSQVHCCYSASARWDSPPCAGGMAHSECPIGSSEIINLPATAA